ncbi:hypothetical protein [Salinisphaera sp.]|uniref:hypothetical protein n=1 Tax=Salinisphaera sp. TaxID=1914330 RepID=UPI000C5ECC93|nr:hypothetical protein [Salinisphaera sp.]MBS62441.1 hypothetical protein [Salinisphaera sp.]
MGEYISVFAGKIGKDMPGWFHTPLAIVIGMRNRSLRIGRLSVRISRLSAADAVPWRIGAQESAGGERPGWIGFPIAQDGLFISAGSVQ